MPGIQSYGAYIPLFRLSRAEIARAWGGPPAKGERAVAGFDEDSLTMAVAAARDCLKGADRASVGGLYFASTTAPYKEKQTAATIASVLELPADAVTADFSGSLRCGTNALKAALDAVASGSAESVLVCAADVRLGYPSGPGEMNFGDGAVALLVGKDETIAEVKHFDSRYYEIQDTWRSDRDTFVRTAEDRFSMDEGYVDVMVHSVSAALEKYGLAAADIARAAINAPNARQLGAVAKKLRFGETTQVVDLPRVGGRHRLRGEPAEPGGGAGTGRQRRDDPAGLLRQRLRHRDPGDHRPHRFRARLPGRRAGTWRPGATLRNYEQYLRWRELVQIQPAARPPIEDRMPSPAAQWREVPWEMRLTGTRCRHCGTPQYPPQRVCVNCHTKDETEPYRFTDVPAKVFSFSHDYVMESGDSPVTVTFVDFEGGGRIMCDMTDRDVEAVGVGMPVEMTFRRLYYVNGVYNYWWKCQPVRCQPPGAED